MLERLYAFGAMTTETRFYQRSLAGDCFASDLADGQSLWALSAPLPFTQFVAGTPVPTSEGTLRWARVVGDDGSEVVDGESFVDVSLDAGCFITDLGGDQRCAPTSRAVSGSDSFGDATCSMRSARLPLGPGCSTGFALRLDPIDAGAITPGCFVPEQRTYWRVGPATDGGYLRAGSQCTARSGTYQPLLTQLPPASLPATPEQRLGSGRVRVHANFAGAAQVSVGSLVDTSLGDCNPFLFADGGTFCVPLRLTNPSRGFRDAQCTQAIVVNGFCHRASVAVTTMDACGATYDGVVATIGPPTPITHFFIDAGTTCARVEAPGAFASEVQSRQAAGAVLSPVVFTVE